MAKKDSGGSETNAVRLSFRTTQSNYAKILSIAKEKGWINSQGKPNASAVLNYIIERFEMNKVNKKKKRRSKRRG